jgi:hypothetical protein
LIEKVAAQVYTTENTAVGIRHSDHVAPSIRKKLAITSPTRSGRSVGMVCSRTQTMEFSFSFMNYLGRHCSLVVRVPGYRSTGPGSILGATGFSEK